MLCRKYVTVAALVLVLGACGKLESPPIEVTYRPSLLGAGNILQLKNQSNQALEEIEVTISSERGEVVYQEAQLAGFATLEVGWKKLDGYEIPDDAEIEVRAKGYVLPIEVMLATGASKGNES